MKNKIKSIVLSIILILPLHTIQAQQIIQPAEPNEECLAAWQNYCKADVLWKTGWGLFGTGVGMTIGGVLGWTLTKYEWQGSTWTNPGFPIMCIGGGIFMASIPCLAVGQVKRKSAIKLYNERDCSSETCDNFRLNYEKNNTLWKTGWGFFGIGVGFCLGGGILWATNTQGFLPPNQRDPGKETVSNVGFYTMIAGAGITLASIPCLAVGQVRRKASMQQFDEKCPQQSLLTFSVQTSSNGLGLAINF